MDNYLTFYNPTKIYFSSYKLIGEIINEYGFKRIVIFIGGKSIKKSGRLNEILKLIEEKDIKYILIEGIKPNPDVEDVIKALEKTCSFAPELVLAIGGGSVIDAAKSYANSYFYDGNPIDLNKKLAISKKALPVATIVTIAASGSEMSSSCVISESKTSFKGGFNSPTNYPLFSILDPTFLLSVPKFQLACGAVDIISHSFERYFCPSSFHEVADLFALSIVKSIVDLSPYIFADYPDENVLKEMLYTSTLSHNGITSFGKASKMICHFAEHRLSGRHSDVAHGLGLSWLMPKFLEVNKDKLAEKIKVFGKFVFDDEVNAVKKFKDYIQSLPLGNGYKEYGISDLEMEEYYNLLKL